MIWLPIIQKVIGFHSTKGKSKQQTKEYADNFIALPDTHIRFYPPYINMFLFLYQVLSANAFFRPCYSASFRKISAYTLERYEEEPETRAITTYFNYTDESKSREYSIETWRFVDIHGHLCHLFPQNGASSFKQLTMFGQSSPMLAP